METSRKRWWALVPLIFSVLVIGLDSTIVNVALPTLARDLHAGTSGLQWFVDSYNLVFAVALLPAGMLGDRFGRKRLLVAGLLAFGAASLACSYAGSTGQLVAARAVLGLGGAIVMPLAISILPLLFGADERRRAMGIVLTANAIGFPIGPILGGWMLDNFWWGSVFLINVPVVVMAIVATLFLIPESRSAERRPVDAGGLLTSALGLAVFTYGVIEAGQRGWSDVRSLGLMVAGAVVLGAFLWRERVVQRRVGASLIDLALFSSPSFTWGTALATIVVFSMFGLLFALPQYFQAVGGADALGSGVRLLPIIGGLTVGARVGGRVQHRVGAKALVVVGFVLLTVGCALGAATSMTTPYWFTATWVTIVGTGFGLAMPTAMDAAIGALARDRVGVGTALMQALRQVGGTIGVALLGTVLGSAYRSGVDVGNLPAGLASTVRDGVGPGTAVAHQLGDPTLLESVQHAFVDGMSVMLSTCAAISVLGIALAAAFLPRKPDSHESQAVDAAELSS